MKTIVALVCALITANVCGSESSDYLLQSLGLEKPPPGTEITNRILRAVDPCAPPPERLQATVETEQFAATLALALAEEYELRAKTSATRAGKHLNVVMHADATKGERDVSAGLVSTYTQQRLLYLQSANEYAEFARHIGWCVNDTTLYWYSQALLERTSLGRIVSFTKIDK